MWNKSPFQLAEEYASLHAEDGAYAEAGRSCDNDVGEGAELASLSSSGKGMASDEVGDYGAGRATSRVGGGFGVRLPKTSSGEEAVTEADIWCGKTDKRG